MRYLPGLARHARSALAGAGWLVTRSRDAAAAVAGTLRRGWVGTVARARAWWAAIVARVHAWRLRILAMAARLASHRRTVFRMAIVVGLASITLGTAGFAASRLYPAFGSIKAASDAQSWAGHPLAYSAGTCASCHAAETVARYGTVHAGVNCQGCHGPLAGHPADDEGSDPLVVPASEICVTCHAVTAGRPGALPQVDPTSHYSGGICLRCHDPHSVVAVAPPDVTHPLTDLPACTTCHAPDGLKQVPAGHEMVEDAVCLSCHGVPTNGR